MRLLRTAPLIALILCFVASSAVAGTAKLQIIHNAADPGAATVDVYVNEALRVDDFAFRTATEFIEVLAGVTLDIGVAGGGSSGPGDILKTFSVEFESGQTYVAVANGVLASDAYAENPEGANVDFTIIKRDGIRTRGCDRCLVQG